MTIEELKKKLESHRMSARSSPQRYLQEFTRLNNLIQGVFEHSQDGIRRRAQKAREELRAPSPSPSPERPVQKRDRVDILGYMEKLEALENPSGSPNKVVVSDTKPKKRAKKARDPQPKTVHEALLKYLQEPTATDTNKKQDSNDVLFDELFGPGPSEEPELDLEAQLELDLSEL